MFKESNYDKLTLPAPTTGMNRNISGDSLSQDYAYYLKNLIATPLGELNLRYGTKKIIQFPQNVNSNIIKLFPFRVLDGQRQIIFHISFFSLVNDITNVEIKNSSTIQFSTQEYKNFVSDTFIKITYSDSSGTSTLTYPIILATYLDANTVQIQVPNNSFINNYIPLSIYTIVGSLHVYDEATKTVLTGDNQSFAPVFLGSVLRGCFQTTISGNQYWLYNGVDPLITWNGQQFTPYIEFIKENARSFSRINNTSFSFTSSESFDIYKYKINSNIKIRINQVSYIFSILSISQNNNIFTLTTQENLPDFSGNDIVELFYSDTPPPFSYMTSINNRMFCLGPGAIGRGYRANKEALNVYYSSKVNIDSNGFRFFDETEKEVPVIDISGTHGCIDNLESIVNVNGKTAFLGRNATQIWSGLDPDNEQSSSYFHYERTLPGGTIHGDLVQEMENDVMFVSTNGIRTLGSLNISQQMAMTPVTAIDPIVVQHIKNILSSNYQYRLCDSFRYRNGGIVGFKIGSNDTIISLYKTNSYSWSFFSGDFKEANCFLDDLDESLYLSVGDTLYRYADGTYNQALYGDQDGTRSIDFAWTSPLINKRWANSFVRVYANYSSSFFLADINKLSFVVNTDIRQSNILIEDYNFEEKGDPLGSISLAHSTTPVPVETSGLRLRKPFVYPVKRMKFQGNSFWVSIIGKCLNSPLSLKRIELFGKAQR